MSSLIYHNFNKDYHIKETCKPFKTKDGYTVYTLRICSGPAPEEPKKRNSRFR